MNSFNKLTAALSRPFTYGIICLLFGALFASGYEHIGTPSWIIDIVMVATGGIIILFALVQMLVALFGKDSHGLLFFFAVIKAIVLLAFGILFIIFRSGLAHAVCVVVGIYLVLRSGWRLFVISRVNYSKSKAKRVLTIIGYVLAILIGLWMAIYPYPSDFLVGGAVLAIKGVEMIITDFPVKRKKKDDGDEEDDESGKMTSDGYVSTDFKDIT